MDIEQEMQQMYADLFEAAAIGRQQGEQMASSVGQTQARWQTMWTIESAPLTVPQVARRLGVSRQNIQRIADELRREQLLCLIDNPDHKTSPLLHLTDAGRKDLAAINAAAEDAHQRMLAHFSQRDVKTFRALLAKFVAAIRAASPDTTPHAT
ncbi:MAG TPA: MarR family winged helix-turn-helix transcriptional regulator [Jatrophihabitantaceae bacterium]